MSRLAELIAELCPDGVEYRRLDELFATRNGYTPSRSDKSAWDSHDIPWFRMEDIRENGGILDRALTHVSSSAVKNGVLFPENSLLVATSATIGAHALITVPHLSNQRFTSLQLKDQYRKYFDCRFLYYYCFVLDAFCLDHVNVSSFPSVDMKAFRSFKFPFVPLAVQREIVRILDQFTTLEAELEAELEARRTQYEHYRNLLLSQDSLAARGPVEMVKLGDMLELRAGNSISSKFIFEQADSECIYPCYGANGLRGYVQSMTHENDASIIGRQGALCGNVTYAYGPFFATEHAVVVTPRVALSQRWLYHSLIVADLSQYATKSAQPGLSVRRIAGVEIPVPCLSEQRRIANLLDRFDSLVNDISSGLPAEIAARRAQYEYYRDRLLSFPEKQTE